MKKLSFELRNPGRLGQDCDKEISHFILTIPQKCAIMQRRGRES